MGTNQACAVDSKAHGCHGAAVAAAAAKAGGGLDEGEGVPSQMAVVRQCPLQRVQHILAEAQQRLALQPGRRRRQAGREVDAGIMTSAPTARVCGCPGLFHASARNREPTPVHRQLAATQQAPTCCASVCSINRKEPPGLSTRAAS